MHIHPKKLILIGLGLVVFGALMPFLMVMRVVESTFFLNFLSYGASICGLVLGVIGTANYTRFKD